MSKSKSKSKSKLTYLPNENSTVYVKNIDANTDDDILTRFLPNRSLFIPKKPFRLLMFGESGCGKTTEISSLILYYLVYNKIIIVSKSAEMEGKFNFLKKRIGPKLIIMGDETTKMKDILEKLSKMDFEEETIIWFDDYGMLELLDETIGYFFKAIRKKGTSLIVSTQILSNCPISDEKREARKAILGNATDIVIFSSSASTEIANMLQMFKTPLLPPAHSKRLHAYFTRYPFNFLYIDKRATKIPELSVIKFELDTSNFDGNPEPIVFNPCIYRLNWDNKFRFPLSMQTQKHEKDPFEKLEKCSIIPGDCINKKDLKRQQKMKNKNKNKNKKRKRKEKEKEKEKETKDDLDNENHEKQHVKKKHKKNPNYKKI